MTHALKQRSFPALLLFTALLLILAVLAPKTSAAEYDPVIKLTGRDAEGKYELTTKDLYFFHMENIAPGDSLTGSVKVENDTASDMAVSVHSIKSALEKDTALVDVLDLNISVAGEESYHGDYAAGRTGYYLLSSGEDLYFDIEVTFPSTAGNEYQGAQMDSTWTFDAIYYEPKENAGEPSAPSDDTAAPFNDIVKTGTDLTGSNTALITSLFVLLLAFCAATVTYIRYRSVKKAREIWEEREQSSTDESSLS